MLYLSQLLGATVENQQEERLGRIMDILVLRSQVGQSEPTYPSAFLLEGEEEVSYRVPLSGIQIREGELHSQLTHVQLGTYVEGEAQEILLARDVLDKQVIDLARKKPVRVNDLCFEHNWQIVGIDSSPLGLVRRLAPAWLLGGRGRESSSGLIAWEQIELIEGQRKEQEEGEEEQPERKRSQNPSRDLGELLYPADIAEIVHQLSPGQGARVIEGLDDEIAADTMEEIETERQVQILDNLPEERAARILKEMGPDEIADLLAQMSDERAQDLLKRMEPEDSEEVQELLEYEGDTAGGLMTTDYIVLNQSRSVGEALESVRREIQENDVRIAVIYCVEDETCDECRVLGMVTLWDLLIAENEKSLQSLMEPDVIAVRPEESARVVAETIAKYNLLVVPVINENGIIEGVVTVDDAIDVLLPEDRKRKRKRMY